MNLYERDKNNRKLALNPRESFIVQAPAGSGKTELLIQRYLQLLAHAEKAPEEIIAITFTRKAAGEMRERITEALELAKQPEPKDAHKLLTWQLANKALALSQQKNWQLENNPNRLRIMTIDALSAMLNSQIPLLSGFGANVEIDKAPQNLYRGAAKRLLNYLKLDNSASKNALEFLLLKLDNNADTLVRLLEDLLKQREQWLPHIMSHYFDRESLRVLLEKSLEHIYNEALANIQKTEERELSHAIEFTLFANKNLKEFDRDNLEHWQLMADLFLTKEDALRKTVDKRNGFPPEEKAMKARITALLTHWSEDQTILLNLQALRRCPNATYTDSQWQMIDALLELLPLLTAELNVIFQEQGTIDFVEQTLGSLRALGNENEPTELALHLDYQIRHLLIDEFQDTSVVQFHLIEKIVGEWQPHDGRTLFIVGDPMQSIYRFRQAEVSLFLRLQQEPLRQISLTPLTLHCNFRSQQNIVDWVNQHLPHIMPSQIDLSLGAVPYTPAVTLKTDQQGLISFSLHEKSVKMSEAEFISEKIEQIKKNRPDDSIAILVKTRSQLNYIVTALIQKKINYQAIEIEALNKLSEIQDLISLIRALHDLADDIAWYAILRAPWCGLLLADLLNIAQIKDPHLSTNYLQSANPSYLDPSDIPIWYRLQSVEKSAGLRHFCRVIDDAFRLQSQMELADWLEHTWLQLGGAHLATENHPAIERFFEILREQQHDFNLSHFLKSIDKEHINPAISDKSAIQIMTIHKSKGLEFDHVFLPGLNKRDRNDDKKLLQWAQRISIHDTHDLVMAPIKPNSEAQDKICEYLSQLEKAKLSFEQARLLYVAVTRAKKSLHLSASMDLQKETAHAEKNSLLNLLWPQTKGYFVANLQTDQTVESYNQEKISLHRIKDFSKINAHHLNKVPERLNPPYSIKPISAKQIQAQITGTIVHEFLQSKNLNFVEDEIIKTKLRQHGVTDNNALATIQLALKNCRQDARAQWILQAHSEEKNELALNYIDEGELKTLIIDRTFVDSENVRWIIDYKTSQAFDDQLPEFLAAEKAKYLPQLTEYAKLFAQLEDRPIKLGLYFPLCLGWIEWEHAPYQLEC